MKRIKNYKNQDKLLESEKQFSDSYKSLSKIKGGVQGCMISRYEEDGVSYMHRAECNHVIAWTTPFCSGIKDKTYTSSIDDCIENRHSFYIYRSRVNRKAMSDFKRRGGCI